MTGPLDAVELASRLISIPGLSGAEADVADEVEQAMASAGYRDVFRDQLGSVIGIAGPEGETPALLFDGHMDVVPAAGAWTTDPFQPVVRDGRLYGRGSTDMKAGLAAAIAGVAAAAAAGHRVEAIPGPSAVLAILSISGFPAVPFTFHGFPPPRRGERDRWYAARASRPGTAVLFESPFRIVESLEALAKAWEDPPVVLGRELTKLHEEVLRGRASELARLLGARPGVKGEIVLAAAASSPQPA